MMSPSEESRARSTLTSGLVALFFESLVFGALSVLYCICAWTLFSRRRQYGCSTRDVLLFSGSTIMFILTLVHVVLDVYISIRSFVVRGGDLTQMSVELDIFNALSNTIGAAKFGIYVTQTLIGDGFMIYRAYIVWDRWWRVVSIPLILLAAEVAMGYYISFSGPAVTIDCQKSKASCIDPLVNAFFMISFATNMLSSALIMRRILSTDIVTQDFQPAETPLRGIRWRVVESILQSAAIYSIASIALAVTSFVSPTIVFPACHSVFPSVISIAFLIIVMRICSNATPPPELPRHSMIQVTTAPTCGGAVPVSIHSDHRQLPDGEPPQSPSSLRSLPIAIHVSVSTTSYQESVLSFERDSPRSTAKLLGKDATLEA